MFGESMHIRQGLQNMADLNQSKATLNIIQKKKKEENPPLGWLRPIQAQTLAVSNSLWSAHGQRRQLGRAQLVRKIKEAKGLLFCNGWDSIPEPLSLQLKRTTTTLLLLLATRSH